MKSKILLLSLILIIGSCKEPSNNHSIEIDKAVNLEMENCEIMAPPPPEENENVSNSTKLIKRGDLTISSTDIEFTKKLLYRFVKSCGGYVTNENLVSNDPNSYYQISLNIQASNFDRFIYLLDSSKLNIVSRRFSVEDVTMSYIDDATRLENKKKLEKRYLDLLSKTKDIKDILAIEEKLENIRTDIEVKENQLKVLDKQIAYSEFAIKISKTSSNLTVSDRSKYTYKIGQGFNKGWDGIKEFGIFLFSIWPIYLIIGLVYLLVRRLVKKRKNKKIDS